MNIQVDISDRGMAEAGSVKAENPVSPGECAGLSAPFAFLLGLCLVADQLAILVILFVQGLHGSVTLRSGCHLDKGKTLWPAGKMIDYQVGVDDFAKIAEELENFRFGYIIWQIAYKEFQAASPWECDRQQSLSATKMQGSCKTTDEKHYA
jgi:hypothetical protein